MPMYRRKPVIVEAMQFSGDAAEIMAVCEWVRDKGYPWLLGSATAPNQTLIPEGGGKPGDKGIWIDPGSGMFIIRTRDRDIIIQLDDWIMFTDRDRFERCDPDTFRLLYQLV